MSGGSPNNGAKDSYDGMTPIPVISHNPTNNALVINNPVQANEGIASAEHYTGRIQWRLSCFCSNDITA